MKSKRSIFNLFTALFWLWIMGCNSSPRSSSGPTTDRVFQALSLLGDSLFGTPSAGIMSRFDSVRSLYLRDTMDIDNIIWYGRFTAYKKDYRDAIDIYSRAIREYPDEPRLYRHRGHRYVSIREFDLAIRDLAIAASLVEDLPNEVEPDGMPNARNIPVSTLHGNIWYHLGLAYYLKQDWENALDAYTNCLQSADNPDNIVSSTHWLYMISRRMGDEIEAKRHLDNIFEGMDIIENHAYYNLCLFYKGLLTENELVDPKSPSASQAAALYGLGNWYFYNGELDRAREIYDRILEGDNWDPFGYIAAEADYVNHFSGQL